MFLNSKLSAAKNFMLLCVGTIIYGFSLGFIISPNSLAPGGIAGISVMLKSFVPLGVGTFTILLNIPLLILGRIYLGRAFLFSTLFAIALSGVTADLFAKLEPLTRQPILAALSGGALMGLGCGLVFRGRGTTGGTDVVARLIKLKKPHLRTGQIFLSIDGLVCISSGIVFKSFDAMLYSFLTLIVFSRVLDKVLYGGEGAKMVIVMSEKSGEILPVLLNKAGVGCTVLKGRSGYRGNDMDILLCAMKKQHLTEVRDIVLSYDDKAFMLVGNTNEIFGEGFKTEPDNF